MKYVEDRVSKAGSSKVWLTGHSLGAAIAMLAGKNTAKRGKFFGDEDSFAAISGWNPCLFVNSRDFTCQGDIEHFKKRRKSDDVGVWGLISHHSLRNIVMKELKIMDVAISEPLQLLPSANLIENLSPPEESISPHKLRHWWKPDLNSRCTVYNYE
ncbi:hypothetical protein PVK06_029145 [Gossypium arboreum]|uniref:Fungal lipase-type domain-containing protein n=1 Tax=Gossypium arboreum TaxID=29729 RepID=A0ABR0P5W9_GOSAR|nr:hypothetical protein PVK06_029145 [Gossypium arboreum]